MLGFVQNWFGPKVNPIGVDFGSDCLRLAQVQYIGGECRLIAAASADVPSHVRHNPAGRNAFFIETIRELLAQGKFRGRNAILALPVASMFFQHLRIAKMDDDAMKKALPWEAQGKLPIDPAFATMRHVLAGEVFHEQEAKNEVIIMAAGREVINQFLDTATRAGLEVVGMNVEPKSLLDCFFHLPPPKDPNAATCFIDIGCTASRAYIVHDHAICFARAIPVGGDTFSRAVANTLKIPLEEAKLMRIKLAAAQAQAAATPAASPPLEEPRASQAEPRAAGSPQEADPDQSMALLGAALQAHQKAAAAPAPAVTATLPSASTARDAAPDLEQAIHEPLAKLIDELNLCRRYHESTFPNKPLARLVFVGGEARHRPLCQQIARQMGLAAQVGDPLALLDAIDEIDPDAGLDRTAPQPAWAVAIGLSIGPSVVQPQPANESAD
jgi:type IV pilus assembly protein PilM